MPDKIKKLKNNLDIESIKLIDLFLKRSLEFPNTKFGSNYYVNLRDFIDKNATNFEKKYSKIFSFNLPKYKKKYILPTNEYNPDVFLFHHRLYYSNEKIKEYIKNKDFIDGGAYFGDTALVLNNYSPKKIYSFEISQKLADDFYKTMEINNIPKERYEFIQKGISNKKNKIYINDTALQNTNVIYERNSAVEMTDIDSFTKENNLKVGFIKMDIEGYNYEALQGMKEIIKKDRPVISIAIYQP